jgi:hypothetical protein
MKYFTSATMLGGLPPPQPLGEHALIGGVTLGLELGWLLARRPRQAARVFFRGTNADDLTKVPVVVRPTMRVGLPWRFSAVAAIPARVEMFGVTPRLFVFGCRSWNENSVRSGGELPGRLGRFMAASADVVSLRDGGTEVQFAYRNSKFRRIIPHVAAGINFIPTNFQVDAQFPNRADRTQLWSRGMALKRNRRCQLSVYELGRGRFQRDPTRPRTIDGLFNVRALISYILR